MRAIRCAAFSVSIIFIIISAAEAAEPELEWAFKAESNLYAPPLVADVAPSPGKETILCDSEVRQLRCIDAQGKPVWEYDGGWKKRLISAVALSANTGLAKGALVVGNADGTVCCVDAETGKELWRRTVGQIEWGAALWADVNGDGRDEAVVPTEDAGIVALDAEGNPLWKYHGAEGGPPVSVRCPAAAADIDGDGRSEIFAAGRFGPLCLNGDGALRWETLTGDDFLSAVIIADADGNGEPELYCCSKDDNAAWCFDARTGAVRWKTTMAGGADVYPSSSLAVADVDDDGVGEIVLGDRLGYVYCLDASGAVRWIFPIEKRTHAAPSVGDVDGDGEVEILVAGGDHYLYCIDARGALEWRYKADLRLIYPATIADVDNDGKTEILFCGSDKTLRCLTLGGRYAPERMPWPSRRFDAAQSGSSFGKRGASAAKVGRHVTLFLWGGFEQTKAAAESMESARKHQPIGWIAETVSGGNWALDSETKLAGSSSLKVTTGAEPFRLATELIPLEKVMLTVDARVAAKGGAPKAWLRWIGLRGVLREDALERVRPEDKVWPCMRANGVCPPRDARWLQMVLETQPGETWWDGAGIDGVFEHSRTLRALVNQAGYDIGAPKRFTVQSTFMAQQVSFALLDENDAPVFESPLQHRGDIDGAYNGDWGYEYWRGDFSAFNTPGKYRIQIRLDDMTDVSWPFEIGENVLWEKTSCPAYRFFYYQRCGIEVPGFHKACHLDDAVSPDRKVQHELWGGWHDAGDYNTYDNVPYLLGLTAAYGAAKEAWDRQDEDGNGVSDFFDEILWGGDHERRMVAPDGSAYGAITSGYGFWGPPELETDNIPGTGDERAVGGNDSGNDSSMHAAALAAIAFYTSGDKGPWVEIAQRALDRCIAQGQGGPWPFSAAVYLYAATQEQRYADLAKKLFPGPNVEAIAAIRLYDSLFHEDHSKELGELLVKSADEALKLAKNPFGIYTHGPEEKPNFFGTPPAQGGWHVGGSSYVLQAAGLVALACQYKPDPHYFEFVYDQLNWILGNNPYDISLMEGVGSAFPPTYHHRYTFSGVPRGAVPGSVVNGITWRAPGDDCPYFDMRGLDIPDFESNEVWLPHNVAFLNALVNLNVARQEKLTP